MQFQDKSPRTPHPQQNCQLSYIKILGLPSPIHTDGDMNSGLSTSEISLFSAPPADLLGLVQTSGLVGYKVFIPTTPFCLRSEKVA